MPIVFCTAPATTAVMVAFQSVSFPLLASAPGSPCLAALSPLFSVAASQAASRSGLQCGREQPSHRICNRYARVWLAPRHILRRINLTLTFSARNPELLVIGFQLPPFQSSRNPIGARISGRDRIFKSDYHRNRKSAALNSAGDVRDPPNLQWDVVTEQLSGSATLAFLFLQIPQIVLNTQNLLAGNNAALFAVPWTGLLTGLLGNLSLLSYFAGKRERGATIVQAVGVLSTFVVLVQLAIAGSMPIPVFTATAVAVLVGFVLNFLNYSNLLNTDIWRLWLEIISIGGVSVLPQVMWTTFEPYLPPSILPGTIFLVLATFTVILGRLEKLPKQMMKFMGGVSAWSATLLFMWGPVAQMWTNYINPANIKGLSVLTILLAMTGNSLLLPRALFTRDLMWFTGSSWGALMQGWAILLSMYINKCITGTIFLAISLALAFWLGNMLVMDSKAYSLGSPFSPLIELFSGDRS